MNKTAIKNFAVSARTKLVDAVTQRAYEYEVTENGRNIPFQELVNGHSLTPAEKHQRSQLIKRIRRNGFHQTMEEVAYTWFNRFIALRFMEVNNYLPSHTRIFTDENGDFKPEILSNAVNLEMDGLNHEYVLELLENQNNETLYKYLIITQCNALNAGLPEMFEEIGGWTELLFPANLLHSDSVIANMVSMIPEDDWKEQVQIIGWLYQYYNTEPKDKVFADLKKNIKISASAIPAATQLFTPDWIVRYMVNNSLGRLWLEGHENSEIKPNLDYYLEEAEQKESVRMELEKIRLQSKNIQPEQIKFFDPCMGSGHILVYAFDVLMQIYVSCGYSERDAVKSILHHNLYGLDIDRRAYQLAYFAIMMKARSYHRRILSPENQPNLANFADTMGVDSSMIPDKWKSFVEQFQFADIYGSLMKVTPPEESDMAVLDLSETSGINRRQLEMMLQICHMMNQKYDVVCTNPPNMGNSGMNGILSDYVKKNFPDSKADLFACFMEQGTKFLKENGYNCMVTMQSWMFLSSFEEMRKKLITNHTIVNLMHMENMVMGIAFGTAVTSFRKGYIKGYQGTYHYIKLKNIENGFPKTFPVDENRFAQVSTENFSKISGMPIAYWISENFIKTFENPPIDQYVLFRQGMATSDNNRFLRLWHEISQGKMCDSAIDLTTAKNSQMKWFPYNKGGLFRKWYGNQEYVVNWENDGAEMKAFTSTLPQGMNVRLKSREYYFKECYSWSKISGGSIAFRYYPNGFAFDVAGCCVFDAKEYFYYFLGLSNSIITAKLAEVLSPTMNSELEHLKKIPVIISEQKNIVDDIVKRNIRLSKKDWDSFEISWCFERHPLI